jgi:hypothetical protein
MNSDKIRNVDEKAVYLIAFGITILSIVMVGVAFWVVGMIP